MPDVVKGFVLDGGLPAVLGLIPFLSFTSSSITNCQLRIAICGSLETPDRRGRFDSEVYGGLLLRFAARNGTTAAPWRRSVQVCKLSCLPVHVIVDVVTPRHFFSGRVCIVVS